jgi:hypothetical protein
MSWSVGQLILAEATAATVGGHSIAGGAQLDFDVTFRVNPRLWEKDGALSLVPQPSAVTARLARGELQLGVALPDPKTVLSPGGHAFTADVRFALSLGKAALVDLEAARDGGPIAFSLTLAAHAVQLARDPRYASNSAVLPTVEERTFDIPKEQWLAVLASVGFCDAILTELRLPTSGPEATRAARAQLVKAAHARDEGRYRNTMQACRIALDGLKNAGFGGRRPEEVARFLQQNARKLSQAERFSALQVAMQLFLSPAHHDGLAEEELSREDADLALAVTATLLRLAPRWGADATDTSSGEESTP